MRLSAEIAARRANLPIPASSAFRFKVLLEIEQARGRCQDLLGVSRRGRPSGVSAVRATPAAPAKHPWGRGCKGCGGHLDELDTRCANCVARHEMRRRSAVRKAA